VTSCCSSEHVTLALALAAAAAPAAAAVVGALFLRERRISMRGDFYGMLSGRRGGDGDGGGVAAAAAAAEAAADSASLGPATTMSDIMTMVSSTMYPLVGSLRSASVMNLANPHSVAAALNVCSDLLPVPVMLCSLCFFYVRLLSAAAPPKAAWGLRRGVGGLDVDGHALGRPGRCRYPRGR